MIIAENIFKKYGKKEVLKGASVISKPGEIVALVGRNGCGKSTLLQILAGTMKADKADITLWGKNPNEDKSLFAKYIGYVPQDNPLFEDLSVYDNLKFWSGGTKKENADILNEFELCDILKMKVSKLSGGMKRRLAIACMVQRNTPVLLLDEPTSSLDIYYQEVLRNWIKSYVSRNATVIMSTHNEMEIKTADVIYLFNEGKTERIERNKLDIEYIRRSLNGGELL